MGTGDGPVCTALNNHSNNATQAKQNLSSKTNELKVDLGDLQDQKENLTNYLRLHLKVEYIPSNQGLKLNAPNVSPQELERQVNKFVYHQNLNSTHWVKLEKNVVKINRFKHAKKTKENKNPVAPTKISHGW
jgi:hypothetical protein